METEKTATSYSELNDELFETFDKIFIAGATDEERLAARDSACALMFDAWRILVNVDAASSAVLLIQHDDGSTSKMYFIDEENKTNAHEFLSEIDEVRETLAEEASLMPQENENV